jgi:hypothetical protein
MNYCARLHEIVHCGRRFKFSFNENDIGSVRNGVYLFFEKGESGHGGDRIVRIGYNREQGNLFATIKRHIIGIINTSIFREHIGNCQAGNYFNEDRISGRVRGHFTFVIIKADDKKYRGELRKRLIATVAQCPDCKPSNNWLGKNSHDDRIKAYGLWQVQCLSGPEIDDYDLDYIRKYLIR